LATKVLGLRNCFSSSVQRARFFAWIGAHVFATAHEGAGASVREFAGEAISPAQSKAAKRVDVRIMALPRAT
jgi:hypothetical protein